MKVVASSAAWVLFHVGEFLPHLCLQVSHRETFFVRALCRVPPSWDRTGQSGPPGPTGETRGIVLFLDLLHLADLADACPSGRRPRKAEIRKRPLPSGLTSVSIGRVPFAVMIAQRLHPHLLTKSTFAQSLYWSAD